MNDIATVEDRIAAKLDTKVAGQLVVSKEAGGISFTNATEVMEFAKMMSIASVAVPKHLRNSPGACLGVILQSIEWKMSPFAVANKSYLVNDRLAYEAQLIHAVALQRAPIKGRINFEFDGEGAKRRCRAWATLAGYGPGDIVEYTSPAIGEITVKNSPLWKSDPDQQLTYYSVRALCRRHFPDVLMGIFAPDEFDAPARARDVTPKPTLTEKLDEIASAKDANKTALVDTSGLRNVEQQPPDAGFLDKDARAEINVPTVRTGSTPWFEHKAEPVNAAPARTESKGMDTPLLDTASDKAKEGSDEFLKWAYGLSPIDYDSLDQHMDNLRKITAKADAGRKK